MADGPILGAGAPPAFRPLQDTEIIVTHFRTGAQSKVRQLNGQFKGGHQAMKEALTKAAIDLQRKEAEALRSGLRRPQGKEAGRPEEHLVNALLSEHNRKVTFDGMAVNLVEWLNSERSKVNLYWRGLEDGTSKHVGQIIYGYFAAANGEPHRASESRRFMDPRMVVSRRSDDYASHLVEGVHGLKKGHVSKARAAIGFFRIKHRIEAVHYISKGRKAWEASNSLQDHVEGALKGAGLPIQKK